uniref:Telomere binding protein TBP1 n=1 Tax=Solanum tuberosum TaxID=4113 RepID=M1A7D4_SOLTU
MELELPSSPSAPSETRLDEHDEDYHELALSPTNPIDPPTDVAISGSRALVVVSPLNAEAHPVVPMNPKNRCSELSQRRTRRPFSVAEVEALVEAVEQLGTGRWRDVKICAFEYADHRTYVDVKVRHLISAFLSFSASMMKGYRFISLGHLANFEN